MKENIHNKCKLSIIVPTYNPKEYIFCCLKSILNNDLSIEEYEIIVIYNGKKNRLYNELSSFCSKYHHINLLYTSIAGVSNARNIGLNNSNGQYVSFIDDDDWISPNYLVNMLNLAEDNVIVCSNVKAYNEGSGLYINDYIGMEFNKLKENKSIKNSVFNYRRFLSSSCCKIIPMDVINNVRFNTKIKLSEDSLFMFEISKNIKFITLSDEYSIYYRRVRELSCSNKKQRKFFLLGQRFNVFLAYINLYISNSKKYNFLFFISRLVATFKHVLNIFKL